MTENLYFPFENCQCFTVFKQRSSLGHPDSIHKFLSHTLYESFKISMPLLFFDEETDSEKHPMIFYVCLSSETKSAFSSKLLKVLHLLICSLWNAHEQNGKGDLPSLKGIVHKVAQSEGIQLCTARIIGCIIFFIWGSKIDSGLDQQGLWQQMGFL